MAELEKSLTVTWTFLAKSQLQHILEFWIERNATTTYSERLLDKVSEKTKQLSKYPASALKTSISEIKGNVEVVNYENGSKLTTEQIFWDQNLHYFFTEKEFTFLTKNDTLKGVGFESKEDLSKWLVKNLNGNINIKDIN